MKKILVIAMLLVSMMSFAQMQITRNRVMGALGLGYMMTTVTDMAGDDVSVSVMGLQVPGINYEFEAKPNDMFKIYLYGGLEYNMAKLTYDGTAEDNFSSEMDLNLNPMVKVYLPNNLYVKLGLPFDYNSATSSADDADAMASMSLDLNAQFGYDTREIYIHGLTPWDKFEKGMQFYALYEMGIMGSYDAYDINGDIESVDVEEFQSFFGVAGCYAHYMDNMMIKPYLMYKMQLNDKAAAKDSFVNIGALFAKDFSEKFNLEAGLDFGMRMLEETDAADNDSYNSLMINAMANYYVMPELNIGGGLQMDMDLTTEDANPVYLIMVGAEYTLNLLK